MALEQQTIALIGVGVVIIGVSVGLHAITQADIHALRSEIKALGGDVDKLGDIANDLEVHDEKLEQRLLAIEDRFSDFQLYHLHSVQRSSK